MDLLTSMRRGLGNVARDIMLPRLGLVLFMVSITTIDQYES